MRERPKLIKIAEEMKQWTALLLQELESWPDVTSRRMFGMTALYRKGVIFGALPRTRAFETPNSVAFKLCKASPAVVRLLQDDDRISAPIGKMAGWKSFAIQSDAEMAAALEWFSRAYESCSDSRRGKRRKA